MPPECELRRFANDGFISSISFKIDSWLCAITRDKHRIGQLQEATRSISKGNIGGVALMVRADHCVRMTAEQVSRTATTIWRCLLDFGSARAKSERSVGCYRPLDTRICERPWNNHSADCKIVAG